eukprot:COSAG01_NODE_31882_length_589_cov_25.020408_1_plen_68_part_10
MRACLRSQDPSPSEQYEKSEMLLYKNMIMQESGDLEKALAHLGEIEDHVVDSLSLEGTRGTRTVDLGA